MLRRFAAAGTGAAAVAAALLSPPVASASPAAPATPAGLVRVQVRHSLLGTHTWYRQTFHGLPVLDSFYVEHTDRSGATTVDDGRQAVPAGLDTTATVSASAATAAATTSLRALVARTATPSKARAALAVPASSQAHLAVLGGAHARLVWRVTGRGSAGTVASVVDARSGAVLSQRALAKNESGQGLVFSPNPVVALRDESLKDQGDSDHTALNGAYRVVTLTDLDGSGHLQGNYAKVVNPDPATSADGSFLYTRHDDRFEQVSAYHDITAAQKYLRGLGFTDVNAEAQHVETDTVPDDNSWYDPEVDLITFGSGGVDDAEDQEVVWHELGHAIQDDQVPGFGTSEQAGAIGEGFGDYWAVTMSTPLSKGFDLPCVMDWDATSYTDGPSHCLRRTDGTKTVDDVDGEVHDDGEIWSRALWDVNRALGRTAADRVIIESQFGYNPGTGFAGAARHTVQTANLLYGPAAAAKVRAAFVAREILG